MSDVNPDLKPILDMFGDQLRHPSVGSVLSDWRNTLNKGMLHFGRKEELAPDIDFNTLIYTELNPSPAKSGRRITLEPTLELIGVISDRKLNHRQFHYLRNEMVIIRAAGRWDYFKNSGPFDLKIASEVTVRLPEGVNATKAASGQVLKEVGKLCFSWLVVNKMSQGAGTA
ncbi:MAG: hypothetical protein GC166_12905 [Alphaproteobacteria bacterium]|nr:hypothetical protein [Alphaproteobacteria bacterium]